MKKEPPTLAPASPGAYRQVFKEGEAVLLTVTARWPRLEGDFPGVRRVNRYYDALFQRWRRRWEGPLLERARAAAAQALESLGRPVHLSVAPEQERGPLFRLENGTVSVVEEIALC